MTSEKDCDSTIELTNIRTRFFVRNRGYPITQILAAALQECLSAWVLFYEYMLLIMILFILNFSRKKTCRPLVDPHRVYPLRHPRRHSHPPRLRHLHRHNCPPRPISLVTMMMTPNSSLQQVQVLGKLYY